jgi:hypothetical protein
MIELATLEIALPRILTERHSLNPPEVVLAVHDQLALIHPDRVQ